ncbi:MAG: tyrosine-type recombinase/integrase [Clostridia bacterium]|nr:tyrosine-type recombinase/integrase [Clostridia bacterium]
MDCFFFGVCEPFGDFAVRDNMKMYEDIARVKHIRVHDPRYSHASLLINKGQNILIISKRLGHSDITQTLNTYSHLMPNTQKETMEALNIDL